MLPSENLQQTLRFQPDIPHIKLLLEGIRLVDIDLPEGFVIFVFGRAAPDIGD